MEIHDGKVKTSFVGNSSRTSKFLERMEQVNVSYKIVFLGTRSFPPTHRSPSQATGKSDSSVCLQYGVFDIPRRFDSEQLARKLNLGRSTVSEHLRKAELILVTDAISHRLETEDPRGFFEILFASLSSSQSIGENIMQATLYRLFSMSPGMVTTSQPPYFTMPDIMSDIPK